MRGFISDKTISILKIAIEIGISKRKVLDYISKFKEKGIFKRIAPAKGRYCEIVI